MREIVDKILQEEQAARSEVERAQNQSEDIVLKTKYEADLLIKDAVNKAEELSRNSKRESESKFLAEKERMLKDAKDGAALSRGRREKDIPGMAGGIFSKIITIKG